MNGYSSHQPSGNYCTVVDVIVREADTRILNTIVISVLTDTDPDLGELLVEAIRVGVEQVEAENNGDEVLGATLRPNGTFGVLVEAAR